MSPPNYFRRRLDVILREDFIEVSDDLLSWRPATGEDLLALGLPLPEDLRPDYIIARRLPEYAGYSI